MRQYQPSNVARELKQKLGVVEGGEALLLQGGEAGVGKLEGGAAGRRSNDFVLGQEPQGGLSQGGPAKEPDVKPSTASRF